MTHNEIIQSLVNILTENGVELTQELMTDLEDLIDEIQIEMQTCYNGNKCTPWQ